MSVKIQEKIVSYEVTKPSGGAAESVDSRPIDPRPIDSRPIDPSPIDQPEALAEKSMDGGNPTPLQPEKMARPAMLIGNTYKIKPSVSVHAFYITINDMVCNPGTPFEKRRPFEMFINSKNMDHYQWISALTLIVSAVFRKGGDVAFLVPELKSVFDPKGGYFRKGGTYMPSLVAEIGHVIEGHLKTIGIIDEPVADQHQRAFLDEQRQQYEHQQTLKTDPAEQQDSAFPPGAVLCEKCHHRAMIVMDNCLTCLNCGESKCN